MQDVNETINQSKSLKVLYVEDNADARESTIYIFEEFFQEIVIAVDGEDGYHKFKETPVDIIITDINMPKLNGIGMIQKIRELNSEIPILVVSAYNESGYFMDSIKLGVDGYLLKPIDMEQFLIVLRKVTKKIKLAHDLTSLISLAQQYQDATDKSSIVSKTDLKGIITYVNDEFCQISEYEREEILGKNHNIIRHPDNPKEIYVDLWNTIQNKLIWQNTIRNISKSGKSYYVKTTIKPILDLNGDIIEYIALRDDVTDIMNQNKQLEYFIQYAKNPMLVMMEIVDYENLKKFYGHIKIKKIEEKIGKQLFDTLNAHYKFEKIYILDNGQFAVAQDKELHKEDIFVNIEKVLKQMNNSHMHIGDSVYDISIRMAISHGENVLENCTYALEELKVSQQDFLIANDLVFKEQEKAQHNLDILNTVQTAIKNGNIISYFQPIIDNKTKEVIKYESLVRLIDKDQTLLSPYFFLDIAKQGRFYSQITQIVLQNSFKALYLTDKHIAINLSALDIEKENISNFIFELLEEHKVEAHRIVFELLEDESVKDMTLVKTFIKRVKKYGVLIAIDDFGSGYSNFERLLEYQPDILKIDGSLVKNILSDKYSLDVVKTIIAFAKSQNIQIIAEYVENEAVYNLLNSLGVDFSQGYFFGKPQVLEKNR